MGELALNERKTFASIVTTLLKSLRSGCINENSPNEKSRTPSNGSITQRTSGAIGRQVLVSSSACYVITCNMAAGVVSPSNCHYIEELEMFNRQGF